MAGDEAVAAIPPGLDATLAAFRRGVEAALGDNLTGLYVFGSLVMGDVDPLSSDIDFLAVTELALTGEQVAALATLHGELARMAEWGGRLEGDYAPRGSLRPWGIDGPVATVTPEDGLRPAATSECSADNMLAVLQHSRALAGPPAMTVLPPVDAATLAAGLRDYLAELLGRPAETAPATEVARWTLNVARCLYGLRTGRLSTKPQAARRLAEQAPETRELLAAALAARAGAAAQDAILRSGFQHLRRLSATASFLPPCYHCANTSEGAP